ncbi:MAG TPA: aminoglycoside phosphotransferase family protein [Gaiellaceae bacterium]|nr:aminoglycoside phosphotransferase family protein [Gaiellaceae bacterium]
MTGPDFSSPLLEATRDRLLARFGAPLVEPWWAGLPSLLADLAARWEFAVGDAVGRGNTSLVLRCRRADRRAAILKLTPDAGLAAAEGAALRGWGPSGRVPHVWEDDAAVGALLLEAIRDERPLPELRSTVDVAEIAGLVDALHRAAPPTVLDRAEPLAGRLEFIFALWIERHSARGEAVTRAVPVERLHRGRELARLLAADALPPVLLHGDLHPGNVLDGGPERGLVAIDPRPCVGEAAVDLVDWVFWGVDPAAWEPRSRELAAALDLEQERLWAWCAAFGAMLAASRAGQGAEPEEIAALLALAP